MNNLKRIIVFSLLIITPIFSQWQSVIVYFGTDNKLVYKSDAGNNRIPDFSYAGYKNSNEAIPNVSVVKTIYPVSGDNTSRLQSALDSVGQLPLINGIRGALLLAPGKYQVNGTLYIKNDGVVLRGSGNETDTLSNTIIYGKGNIPDQRTIIVAGGGGTSLWKDQVANTKTDITSDSVLIGSREFSVANISPYAVGDNIIIYHPCSLQWLQAIDNGGVHSTDSGAAWTVGSQPIVYNRYITKITGNKITIDVPVFNHLIKNLSQSYIYKYGRAGLKTKIGIEKLRVDIETAGGEDEAHAWQCLDMYQLEDSWVKDCTFIHFGQSGIRSNTATRITIENCKAIDPVSIITGERRYNYNFYSGSQQILFKNCFASNGRHHFISNGTSYTSGIVVYNCTSSGSYTSSEGHRRWTQGMLFDNFKELTPPRSDKRILGLYNRGDYGTSHGWAAAHSVAWNCDVNTGYLLVQKPPTAQNYAIGCKGIISGMTPPAPFTEPQGYIEGSNTTGLYPASLYIAQLNERLGLTTTADAISPKNYNMIKVYPNPFNPSTRFNFIISEGANVSLKIYDTLGKEIKTLVDSYKQQGEYNEELDGSGLASGVYIYTFQTNNYFKTGKIVLLK